jgi:hypothetical protein
MRRLLRAGLLMVLALMLSVGTLGAAAQSGNLIRNPGFELDANLDGRPDEWLPATSQFTRSRTLVHTGTYSGKYFLNRASSSQVTQRVIGISAGTSYVFKGMIDVDAAPGTRFSFDIEFQWRSGSGAIIGRTLLPSGGETKAWVQKRAAIRAPSGAADLLVVLRVTQQNAGSITIYVDGFSLTRV